MWYILIELKSWLHYTVFTDKQCDSCKDGYCNLNQNNPDGCVPCNCDPIKSTSAVCDPQSGQCRCLPNVQGLACSLCSNGYYFDSVITSSCQPCVCDIGTLTDGVKYLQCNQTTGQCPCKQNVQGVNCNTCSNGFYNLVSTSVLGCQSCQCTVAGTDPAGKPCNVLTGACSCKSTVQVSMY